MTTLTSRQFFQDTGLAKRESQKGPVFITHRGRRSHVLLTIEDYEQLAGRQESIVEQLAMPEAADIDFEPVRLHGPLAGDVEL